MPSFGDNMTSAIKRRLAQQEQDGSRSTEDQRRKAAEEAQKKLGYGKAG